MSDIGNALVSGLSGMGSSLGDMFSGVGNAMTGGGGDVGTMFGQMAQALSPVSSAQAAPAVDPAIAAPLTLTPPAEGTPQQQAGQVGGTQSGGAPQPAAGPQQTSPQASAADEARARAAGIDAIRKLFARGRRNPYQTGGDAQPAPGWSSPEESAAWADALGKSAVKQAVAPQAPPGDPQSEDPTGTWEGEGGAPAPEPPPPPPPRKMPVGVRFRRPEDYPPDPEVRAAGEAAVGRELPDPYPYRGPQPGSPGWSEAERQADLPSPTAPEVPPQTRPELLPEPPSLGGSLAGIASRLLGPYGMAARAAGEVMAPTPAETGELPPVGEPNFVRPDAPQTGQKAPEQGVEDPEIRAGGPGHGAITRAPATGKPVKTVDPKTGKAVDPKTGAPLPTKTPLPTKKPGREPPPSRPYYMDQPPPGQSGMIRDVGGMQGVPQMLGALAQIALPLLMGLGGGGGRPFGGHHGFGGFPFGRGGHGRFGGPWRGGHPGGFGSGMWPYHHPGMGWRGFGFHPGGGWRPLHPQFYPGGQQGGVLGFGSGGNPIMDIIGGMLGGGGQQGQGGGGFRRGGGFGYSDPASGPWSANPFLNTLVGAESSGRNSGAPGGGPAGDNGLARGFFNIQTPTWREFAARVPGASRYATADQAPYEIQRAVANTIPVAQFGDRTRRILHAKFGDFDERLTVGQMADRTGGVQTAGNMTAGLPTTPTGDMRVAAQ